MYFSNAEGDVESYLRRLTEAGISVLDSGSRAELAVVLRDGGAALGCGHAAVLSAQLGLARWLARNADATAQEAYARYARSTGPASEPPSPRDVAYLVGEQAWPVLEAWERGLTASGASEVADTTGTSGDEGEVESARRSRRHWLAVAVGAGAGARTDAEIDGLLRLHEAVRTSRTAAREVLGASDAALRPLAAVCLRLMDAGPDDASLGDVLGVARSWGEMYGAVASGVVASAGLWAALPRVARADEQVEKLARLAAQISRGGRSGRVIADWGQQAELVELLEVRPTGAAAKTVTVEPEAARDMPRAVALLTAARAHAALGGDGTGSLHETLTRALAALIEVDRAESPATVELRAALALLALRGGDMAAARAELTQMEALGARRDGSGDSMWLHLTSLVQRLSEFPARQRDGEQPESARPRHLSASWATILEVTARSAAGHVAEVPFGSLHPVAIDLSLTALARQQFEASVSFAEDVRVLADKLMTAAASCAPLDLSLRVAQAEALLRLGRSAHAARVSTWAARKLASLRSADLDDLQHRVWTCEARSLLAGGDHEAVCSRALARRGDVHGELAYLEGLALQRRGELAQARTRMRRAAAADEPDTAGIARRAAARLRDIELRMEKTA